MTPKEERLFLLKERLEGIASQLGEAVTVKRVSQSADLPGDHPHTRGLSRIALEAVSNAIRHGKASRVDIEFRIEEDVMTLMSEDSGLGFDVAVVSQGCMHRLHGARGSVA